MYIFNLGFFKSIGFNVLDTNYNDFINQRAIVGIYVENSLITSSNFIEIKDIKV